MKCSVETTGATVQVIILQKLRPLLSSTPNVFPSPQLYTYCYPPLLSSTLYILISLVLLPLVSHSPKFSSHCYPPSPQLYSHWYPPSLSYTLIVIPLPQLYSHWYPPSLSYTLIGSLISLVILSLVFPSHQLQSHWYPPLISYIFKHKKRESFDGR